MSFLDYITGKQPENQSVLENPNQPAYQMGEYGPVPVDQSPLPAIGGMLGGIAGAALTKNPQGARAGMAGGQAFVRTLIPSLAGSTVGTTVGLGAESALEGQLPSSNRVARELITNALFDVGGNLVFSFGGKAYRVGKEQLRNLGIGGAGGLDDARVAAQQFLSQRGATLTRGQLTGNLLDVEAESLARGFTGAPTFKTQEEGVRRAITQGVEEFKDRLGTSQAFNDALKQGDPTQMAVGDRFKNVITAARDEFKQVHRPFYEQLSKDTNVLVDFRSIKQAAQKEYDELAKGKFAGAGADKKTVLEDILKQDDYVDFATAHDIRSNFGAAARDKMEAGGKSTTLSAGYSKYENIISSQMDNAFSVLGTKDSKDLVRQYKLTQESYKKGMDGLYSGTVTKALEADPEAVGRFLFDPNVASRYRDVMKAVSQAEKYKQGDILNSLKFGFVDQLMSTPDNVASLATKLEQDKGFREGFNYLFKPEERKFLNDIVNSAKFGLTDDAAFARLFGNRAALAASRGLTLPAAAGVGYFVLPDEVKNKLSSNLPETLATLGAMAITPRLMAKALTNKNAQDALANLAKMQQNPKLVGALAAKTANLLNESGIIDNEYLDEINSLTAKVTGTQQEQAPQATEQQAPTIPFGEFLRQ